jgi:hypothetical protein
MKVKDVLVLLSGYDAERAGIDMDDEVGIEVRFDVWCEITRTWNEEYKVLLIKGVEHNTTTGVQTLLLTEKLECD